METFESHYQSLCTCLRKRMPNADMALIEKAVDYAQNKHQTQKRKDGSPYIIHPLAVAQIVAEELKLDSESIEAALLHDCIEDSETTHADIAKQFSVTVAAMACMASWRRRGTSLAHCGDDCQNSGSSA